MAGRPVVLVGCGRLGSALVEGWLKFGPVTPDELIILTPSEKPAAEAARRAGARINPPLEAVEDAKAVVLAVKPARWREAAAPLVGRLAQDAVIVSLMAGIKAPHIRAVFDRPVCRVMPTTAVAQGCGVAAIQIEELEASLVANELFQNVASTVPLGAEAEMDAATATAGSAPAFILSFVKALAEAGAAQGLDPIAAEELARGALLSIAAGVDAAGLSDDLIHQIASPGGTTRAGLDASERLIAEAARAAIDAAVSRARALASEQPA